MKRILFVDATSYNISIPEEARRLRSDYYRLKHYVRNQKIRGLNPALPGQTRSYSVGLLRIASILKHNGYPVAYTDHREINREKLSDAIAGFDIVAFSAVTPTVPMCADLCRRIKAICPDMTVAIGGAHINVAKAHTVSRYPCFDIYADGYDREGAAKLVSVAPETLKLPDAYADYSILPHPLSSYILNTFSTLGCNYRCDYCQDHRVPYYENPDLTGLSHLTGAVPRGSTVHYFDSVLGIKKERAKAVCEALARTDHGFALSCDARAESVTPDFVKMLASAGFVEISLGMETADDRVLSTNNRHLPHSRLVSAFETIRKHSNLYISVYNAVGIPGSTVDAAAMSREKLERLLIDDYIDDIKSCVYVPYPMDGKDYDRRGVILEKDDWACFDRQSFPVYRLENMTSREIWDASVALLKTSVDAWMTKYGISSIHALPDAYCIEYLSERNHLNAP